MHLHAVAVARHDLLVAVLVGVAVTAACVNAVVLGAIQLLVSHFVIADHIRPDLVAIR